MINPAISTTKSADIADMLHISLAHNNIIKKVPLSRSGVHPHCYVISFVAELSAAHKKVELHAELQQ